MLMLAFVAAATLAGPVEDAAEQVARAHADGHAAAVEQLAARRDLDSWLVADELCARGNFDAAEAFAAVVPANVAGKLPACIAAQRAKPTDAELRETLRAANEALGANDAARVLALADGAGGADVTGVRLLHARGLAHRAANRWAEASVAFREAAGAARGLGWPAREALALNEAGRAAYNAGHPREALAAWEGELALVESFGDRPRVAAALANIGNVQGRLGDPERSIATIERALAILEEVGNRVGLANTLAALGATHAALGDRARAVACMERSLGLLEEIGDRAGVARTLSNMGILHRRFGDCPRALDCLERSRRLSEEAGDRDGVARATAILGDVHLDLGDYPRALDCLERAVAVQQELGNRAGAAVTLGSIGNAYEALGDYPRALDFQGRSMALRAELGDRQGVGVALGNLGIVHGKLGDYPRALQCMEEGLAIQREFGDRARIAMTLGNVGLIHVCLGDFARALDCQEQALRIKEELGNRAGVALSLGSIGLVHQNLADYPRALEYLERSRALSEELGDRHGVARMLANIGTVHFHLADDARALDCLERARGLMEQLGDRSGVATTLTNIAAVQRSLGDRPRALASAERARKISEELGERASVAVILGTIGSIHEDLGDYPQALDFCERALALARETGDRETETHSLWGLARVHLEAGRPAEAARCAREAVTVLPALVRGLGEEQGAKARERWAGVFEVGVSAAQELGDAREAAFFLESGRAGSLLESLGGRDALLSRAVPEELRTAEREAQGREAAALRAHDHALRRGERAEVLATRQALDEARTHVEEAVARIQREAKAASSLLYGRVDSLDEIRGRVREGEALLLYGPGMALVVTPEGSRIVALGDAEDACRARDWTKVREVAVEPLALGKDVKRILVSPVGALSYAPFCLLAPGREVAYVPSGTTYGLLLEEAARRGEGVLALGDPDYGTKPDFRTLTLMRGGRDLEPLPATRAEAKAVGSTVLLGADATEPRLFEAVAERGRWRAIHLACHGLVDPGRPLLSSLALSGGGLLTTMEVFRNAFPADLVVLSACETAQGAVYRAEGVVGFVRAFMFAGAPRVLVSLWKVDDEATKALMVRFYEAWRTRPAAAALREAQEFVASQERWKDPAHWAAWQLWGVAE
jgi:tetratricopeptide (TPR) repeat protein